MMSGTLSTATETSAFNEKKKNRALYGDRWNTKRGIGRPGLLREKSRLGASLEREGFKSAEKIAGIGAGATIGAAGTRAAAQKDVAGIRAGSARAVTGMQTQTQLDIAKRKAALKTKELGMRFGPKGVERLRVTKPQFQYMPKTDEYGQDLGYQVYRNGLPVTQNMPSTGQTTKAQNVQAPVKWTNEHLKWYNGLSPEQRKRYLEEARRRRGQ
ncbi:MAG TPA: hypothetical protein ENH07_07820 [Nitrospirae bacterium]|nr:hypothetical protein [Nitrospirota bacterium]